MASTEDRLIDDWARHWSAHDTDSLAALFTDDLVYEDVTMGRVNQNKGDLRTFAKEFFAGFPDVAFEIRSRFATGSQGGVEWVMRGTHSGDIPRMPATGKRVEIRGASVLEFNQGKIRRCSDYWDMATFLRQIGMMPGG